MREAERRRLIR
jgi:colicin import membrane protein